jgi:hypothetical protein
MSDTGHIPSLEEMANRMAIQDVLNKHSRGVDRADGELLKSAYWPEAEVAYGGYNGPAHAFCETLPAAIKRYAATAHRVTNVSIDFHGDDAVVESYVTAYHYLAVDDGEDTEMTYVGRYVDHMQRRGEQWKIMFRRVVMEWNQNLTASALFEGPTFSGLARGGRAPDDPLYEMQQKISGGS